MRAIGLPRSKDLIICRSTGFVLKPPDMEKTKEQVNNRLVVATLVASVTFAAGFAVPGGFSSSDSTQSKQGLPVMLHHGAFQAFVILNCIAMYLSIVTVFQLLCTQVSGDPYVAASLLSQTTSPMLIALLAASAAFMAGTYLTMIKLPWLACVSLVIGSYCLLNMVAVFCIITDWAGAHVGLGIIPFGTVALPRYCVRAYQAFVSASTLSSYVFFCRASLGGRFLFSRDAEDRTVGSAR